MIASDRNYPFNSRVTTIHTTMYSCMVSTSKEGLFKKQSTMIFEMPAGQLRPRRAVAKIIYTDSLRPGDRLQMHEFVARSLNVLGESVSLGDAIENCPKSLKGSGAASEVVNLLWEDKATVTKSTNIASPDRCEDSEITEMSIDEEESEAESHETPEQQHAQLEAENIRGKMKFDGEAMVSFAELIADALSIQLIPFGARIPDLAAPRGAKALGYVYGFVDAGLRVAGHDIADTSIGVPIMYQVLRRVFPGSEERYLDFIITSIKGDPNMMAGTMLGGQQYLDWVNRKLHAPMGLARCVAEVESN